MQALRHRSDAAAAQGSGEARLRALGRLSALCHGRSPRTSLNNTQALRHRRDAAAAQGSEEDALRAAGPPGALAPAWRVMLLSDGSVTRHLQLLTGLRVEVVRALRCPRGAAARLHGSGASEGAR